MPVYVSINILVAVQRGNLAAVAGSLRGSLDLGLEGF